VKILFSARYAAEAVGPWPDWAIVSITERGQIGYVKIKHGWLDELEVYLHPGLSDDEAAANIIEFARKQYNQARGILIVGGPTSALSAAVAKWISEDYGAPLPEAFSHYSKPFYDAMRGAA
jgi:hypothetical protein